MIRLLIIHTAKGYAPKEKWYTFDQTSKCFEDLKAAKTWIREQYGNRKKHKMYIDTPQGSKVVGYVIGFRNADYSHSPLVKWLQQDWIEFSHIVPVNLEKEVNHGKG